MPLTNAEEVLRALLASKSPSEVRAVLQDIGDSSETGLDTPSQPFEFCWHAFGDNPSNISSIGLASKAGRSLTERVTNAVDAVLEHRVQEGIAPPNSPRRAAEQWFGRPVSGPDEGAFRWDYSAHKIDRRTAVILHDSQVPSAPTIDVFDDGIGIRPEEFASTILSLQAGNKIKKLFLVGAFGQGGASTLAFCDYAIIVSRHAGNPRVVGFTVIRVVKLDATWKEDCYAYLSLRDSAGNVVVPSCQLEEPLDLYPESSTGRHPRLTHGTVVRHVGFKLSGIDGQLGPSPGNLYHYLHASLFDPLLPFRVIDLRIASSPKNELISGSRNRLMQLVEARKDHIEEQDKGSQLRHYRPMEFVNPHGSLEPTIGIEYWVILNFRKARAPSDPPVLRAESNELFIHKGFPIVGTLNGQNQGELRAKYVRDLGLGMVARHLIVNIDATNADSRVRRELFATNREGFKEGPVLDGLIQVLIAMLEEDSELHAIERELTEKLAKRESQSTRDEVKRQVTQLLLEAGLQQKDEGPSVEPGAGQEQTLAPRPGPRPKPKEPLPTLTFPQVTRFEIVSPKPAMKIPIGGVRTVFVETDADGEFDRRQLIAIRTEPDCLELAAKSPLRGGRVRWRLRPRPTSKAGDIGKIIVTLTKPDGTQLLDSIDFEVQPQTERPARKAKGIIPPFDIIPINPDDDPEQWEVVWPLLNENASKDDLKSVAYKPVRTGGGVIIYYSTIFAPFHAQIQRLKQQSAALVEIFTTNYEVWIGYHAILQVSAKADDEEIDSDTLDRLLEDDRVRVATMQVKQALQTAELMRRNIQPTDTE